VLWDALAPELWDALAPELWDALAAPELWDPPAPPPAGLAAAGLAPPPAGLDLSAQSAGYAKNSSAKDAVRHLADKRVRTPCLFI